MNKRRQERKTLRPEGSLAPSARELRAPWRAGGRGARIANRFLKRVRDFAQVIGNGVITKEIAAESLSRLEVDHLGLDSIDRRILMMMIKNYNGGPVGLETLAAATGEEAVTIEDVYEPYLMQIGFLTRTPRGRCATALAYEHLGIAMPAQPCGECEQMRIGE